MSSKVLVDMSSEGSFGVSLKILPAILAAGAVVGVLDAIDAIVAFKVFTGFDPIPIYQFVASGLLGKQAFSGGLGSAGLGLAIHFLIAFSAASAYIVAAQKWKPLTQQWQAYSLAYGVLVYLVMNFAIIPLSKIEPSPFSLPLFLNGVFGHAILVGLPIGFIASRLPVRSTSSEQPQRRGEFPGRG
jgi:hypothetical protein